MGAGSVMVLSEEKVAQLRRELLTDDIRGITRALKLTGVGRDEALALIEQYWDEEDAEAGGKEAGNEEA